MLNEEFDNEIQQTQSLDDITAALESLLSGGYSVTPDGVLYFVRQQVARVKGLQISIFSREHPPPHFHVLGGDVDASFSILDGSFIEGKISGRERALIYLWYERSRPVLVNVWNSTRPTNCPVGPISV